MFIEQITVAECLQERDPAITRVSYTLGCLYSAGGKQQVCPAAPHPGF